MSEAEELTNEERARRVLENVLTLSPGASFEARAAIQLKSGAVVEPGQARCNVYQSRISAVIVWCLLHDRPIRIIGLKPRQKGSSTFFVWCLYHMLSVTRANGCIIGGLHAQGDNLFKMLRLYAAKDTSRPTNKCHVVDRKATWPNGSRCSQETAANPEAGRSGTFQVVVATEAARWAKEGVANAADVLAGLLKCVPHLPRTLVALESTADGAGGDYFDRWQAGITFEELKAGKDGFVKVFAAWFEFADSVRDPKLEGIESEEDLSEKEKELAAKHSLQLNQVAWMRWAIREECKGDFDTFSEDYPFDAESAFLTSGRRRFNIGMLRKMKERAALYPPEFGSLEPQGNGDRVVWQPCAPTDSRVLRWEKPRPGCRYLLPVDLMTGASQVGGKDPDNHAPCVIRAGMIESGRGWVPPRIVARLIHDWDEWERKRKYEMWWDIDVLEEQVWRLAQYYGNCAIVPEMNKDRGLVELLKQRKGARFYMRKIFNKREHTETEAIGWDTNEKTREMAIEILARAIRKQGEEGEGFDIHDPITLSELETFVQNEKGKSEAMAGKHDDNVLMAAIGLTCIEAATTYIEPVTVVKLPRDLQRLADRQSTVRPGMAQRW